MHQLIKEYVKSEQVLFISPSHFFSINDVQDSFVILDSVHTYKRQAEQVARYFVEDQNNENNNTFVCVKDGPPPAYTESDALDFLRLMLNSK